MGHDDGDGGNGVLTLGAQTQFQWGHEMDCWLKGEKIGIRTTFGEKMITGQHKTYSGFWEIDLHHAQSGESSLTTSNTAVLDTGTTLLIGPSADVQIILDNSGAVLVFRYGHE